MQLIWSGLTNSIKQKCRQCHGYQSLSSWLNLEQNYSSVHTRSTGCCFRNTKEDHHMITAAKVHYYEHHPYSVPQTYYLLYTQSPSLLDWRYKKLGQMLICLFTLELNTLEHFETKKKTRTKLPHLSISVRSRLTWWPPVPSTQKWPHTHQRTRWHHWSWPHGRWT